MHIQESGEMYLETIFVLSKSHSSVRAIDVSEHLGYSKPSVSRAMGILKNGGYITVDASGYITLTESGLAIHSRLFRQLPGSERKSQPDRQPFCFGRSNPYH